LFAGGYPIEAYRGICNKFWPIGLEKRIDLGERVAAAGDGGTPPKLNSSRVCEPGGPSVNRHLSALLVFLVRHGRLIMAKPAPTLRSRNPRCKIAKPPSALNDNPPQARAALREQGQRTMVERLHSTDQPLSRSIAYLAAIVEGSRDAIYSVSLDGRIEFWNAAAQALFGYTAQEAVGQPIALIIPRARVAEEQHIVDAVLRGGRLDHFETTRTTKDGREIAVSLTISLVRDSDGTAIGISKIARDISARKQSEASLRGSKQRLAREADALAALNAWSSRLWRCRDLREGLNEMLDAVIRLLGADKGNVQLLSTDGLLTIEAQRGFDQAFLEHFREVTVGDNSACGRALRSGHQVIIEDVELDEQYASLRLIARAAGYRAVVSTPLISGDGTSQGMVSMHFPAPHRPTDHELRRLALYVRHASDFIHRCKVEQVLRKSEDLLREADYRKDAFLALLAHELRNPLAPIRHALTVNRKAVCTPQQRKWADDIIDRQITHMTRLLDDLLDVSRVTRGRLELKRAPTELGSVLSAAVETARPLLDSKRHQLTLDLPREVIRLQADPVRLTQVFSNLLINAAKYTDAGGHIRLSAARTATEAEIAVRDNGVGISAETMPRLFEMFAQADNVLERTEGGLGVGLALVRGLVTLHGGTVRAQSAGSGRGSEFIVRLPLGQTEPEVLQRHDRINGTTAGVTLKILVVDDNRDAADTCAAVLELYGHEVRKAYTGRGGVELAETFRPHAMFVDIGLPDLNGYALAKAIRASPWGRDVLLVAVTGWGQSEDRQRALDAGFDRHFPKPVAEDAMESVLHTIQNPVVGQRPEAAASGAG
jgi:PAS domain S-box-containing protein